MLKRFSFLFVLIAGVVASAPAAEKQKALFYNTLAMDVPFGGGGMISYSRFWRATRYLDLGWVISGGQIRRKFDLKDSLGTTYHAETKAWVAPLTGPVLSLHNDWIGLALGISAFYADADITLKNDTVGKLTGSKRAWGTGIYSPLLVLDFYDQKHDLVYGFGLGGFFGTSFPDLVARGNGFEVSTNESPINTLTFHVRLLWADGGIHRMTEKPGADEF